MGNRGPAPTPKAELERRGSWRAKVREDELQADGQIPEAPAHLKGEARAEWNRLAATLGPRGVLDREMDRTSLSLLCEALGEYRRLDKRMTRETPGEQKWRSLMYGRNEAWKRWNDLAKRFGLTPADRPRVKVGPKVVGAKATDATHGKERFFNSTGPLKLQPGA